MIDLMRENDSPPEQFERLYLKVESSSTCFLISYLVEISAVRKLFLFRQSFFLKIKEMCRILLQDKRLWVFLYRALTLQNTIHLSIFRL